MLEQHGVAAEAHTDDSGTLIINLTTERAVRVFLNGQPLKEPASTDQFETGAGQNFWGADGKQSRERPTDLSGAGGLADAIRRGQGL